MSQKKKIESSPRSLTFEESEEVLLTKAEIAKFLQVSIKTIDKKVSMDEIPYLKFGNLVRFSKKRVIASMKLCGQQAG